MTRPRLRLLLAVTALATMTGTGAELLLVEHTEDFWQQVPLALLAGGTVALAAAWARPTPAMHTVVRVLMTVVLVSGAVGLWLHYRANAEFELEMYPTLDGWALFWKSIQGASPPSLAPGAMFVAGALGWIWSLTGDAR